jgi:hypothetical protein
MGRASDLKQKLTVASRFGMHFLFSCPYRIVVFSCTYSGKGVCEQSQNTLYLQQKEWIHYRCVTRTIQLIRLGKP